MAMQAITRWQTNMSVVICCLLVLLQLVRSSTAFSFSSHTFCFRKESMTSRSGMLRMSERAENGDTEGIAVGQPAMLANLNRRAFGKVALASIAQIATLVPPVSGQEPDPSPVIKSEKKYSGPSAYGFSFYYPGSWKPNKKPGNKHLYDLEIKPAGGKGQISMTVDAVKVNKIEEYGTLEDVQERVRQQVERLGKGRTVKVEKAEKRTTGDKMTYYTVLLSWDGFQQWTTLTATANQLFVLSSLVPAEAAEVAGTALANTVQSLKVKPNSMDNFQQYGKGQAPGVLEYVKQIPGEFTRIESGDF